MSQRISCIVAIFLLLSIPYRSAQAVDKRVVLLCVSLLAVGIVGNLSQESWEQRTQRLVKEANARAEAERKKERRSYTTVIVLDEAGVTSQKASMWIEFEDRIQLEFQDGEMRNVYLNRRARSEFSVRVGKRWDNPRMDPGISILEKSSGRRSRRVVDFEVMDSAFGTIEPGPILGKGKLIKPGRIELELADGKTKFSLTLKDSITVQRQSGAAQLTKELLCALVYYLDRRLFALGNSKD